MIHKMFTEGIYVVYWFILWNAFGFCYSKFMLFLEGRRKKSVDEDI